MTSRSLARHGIIEASSDDDETLLDMGLSLTTAAAHEDEYDSDAEDDDDAEDEDDDVGGGSNSAAGHRERVPSSSSLEPSADPVTRVDILQAPISGLDEEAAGLIVDDDDDDDDNDVDHDNDNDDNEEVLTQTTHVNQAAVLKERILTSMRLHGCPCEAGAQEPNSAADALDLHTICQQWSNVPDVLTPLSRQNVSELPRPSERLHDFEDILAGLTDQQELDLRLSAVPDADVKVTRRWDIDFAYVVLRSLAAVVVRDEIGFDFVYKAVYTRRLQQSLHISLTTSAGGEPRPLHLIKHMRIGSSTRSDGYSVYIAFPHMEQTTNAAGEPGVHLTDPEQAEWIDDIVIPCRDRAYGAPEDANLLSKIRQHHPRSFSEADLRAKSPQSTSMTGLVHGTSEIATNMPQQRLAEFWTLVQEKMDELGGKWADAHLFALRYGQKLLIEDQSPCVLHTRFLNHLEEAFDTSMVHMDKVYVDFGYEDSVTMVDGQDEIVALRRTACNKADALQIRMGGAASTIVYNWHGTEQCSSITVEPRAKGQMAKAGFAYTQAYNCDKDMMYHPTRQADKKFTQPALTLLAYRDEVVGELQQRRNQSVRADSAGRRTRSTALAFMAKEVANTIDQCDSNMASGFSTRQEFRIRLSVFADVVDELENEMDTHTLQLDPEHRTTHWPFLALRKREVMAYMRKNVNRWLFAITAIVYRDHFNTGSTHVRNLAEQHRDAATLTVLLACLAQAVNSSWVDGKSKFAKEEYLVPIDVRGRHGEDVDDEDDEEDRRRTGLGIRATLDSLGMVWLPRETFNWDVMRFKEDALRVSGYCKDDYRLALRHTQTFVAQDELRSTVTLLMESISAVPTLPIRPVLAEHARLLHRCWQGLHQLLYMMYAREVMESLDSQPERPPCLDSLTEDERLGRHGLNWDMLCRAWGDDHTPKAIQSRGRGGNFNPTGGRSGQPNTMQSRISLLFTDDGRFHRKRWNHRNFRKSYQTIEAVLLRTRGEAQTADWRDKIGTGRAATFLTVLAHYESDKWIERHLRMRWIVALPIASPDYPDSASQAKWLVVTNKKEMDAFQLEWDSRPVGRTVWLSRPMDRLPA